MSLSTNVSNLATAVATNAKSMKTLINGNAADLTGLTTVSKANLVAAINEVAAAVGGAGASIVDVGTSTTSVWSSSKTDTSINTAVAALVDTSPIALDTLNELAAALADDPNFATTMTNALALKAPLTSPTLVTPVIGVATASSVNKVAITAPATNATLTIVQGATLTASATATVSGTNTGDQSLTAYAPLASPAFTGTPTGLTKSHVGLANVDNTSDAAKPVSTAEQTALNLKANLTSPTLVTPAIGVATATSVNKIGFTQPVTGATLTIVDGATLTASATATVSGTNTGDQSLAGLAALASPTFTGTPTLPTGTIATTQVAANSTTAVATTDFVTTADNLKANLAGPTFTGTVGGITKTMVGLANVDNTSDAAKPISTAQASVNTAQTTTNGTFALAADLGNPTTDFVAAFNAGLV